MLGLVALTAVTLAVPFANAIVTKPVPLGEAVFEENRGQFADGVAFKVRFTDFDAAVLTDGSVGIVPRGVPGSLVSLRFEGSVPKIAIEGEHPAALRTNYFRKQHAIVDVPNFARVKVRELRPGIDVAYHTESGRLEYDVVVAPGAAPDGLRLAIDGADRVSIQPNGDLAIAAAGQTLIQRKPLAYQVEGGRRSEVASEYRLVSDKSVEITMGAWDRSRELIIDPVVEYASYLGGSSNDIVRDLKIGPGGYIYVLGSTQSSNFPVAAAFDSSLGGSQDVFVTKIDPFTGRAVYSTFIGGRNGDSAAALAVDASGNVYFTGTAVDQYPTTTGAYRTTFTAGAGFITKLNAAGNALTYSTFLPGATPLAITVDSQGRAIVTGTAGTGFTATAGSYRTTFAGTNLGGDTTIQGDAFVFRLNTAGTAADLATFFGGAGSDEARGVAIDPAGNIVIGGVTLSANLPVSADAVQSTLTNSSEYDGFVAVLSSAGNSLITGSYFGGTSSEEINGLAVDGAGNIIVAGLTTSQDFPTSNAVMALGDLAGDAFFRKGFVTKFARGPFRVAFSTFIGPKSACCDTAYSVATDAAGDIYVAETIWGSRLSQFEAKHPFLSTALVQAKQGTSGSDVYAAAGIKRDGSVFLFNSLVAPAGGNSVKVAISAKDPGQVALASSTYANWVPIAPANGQPSHGSPGGFFYDAFAMSLGIEQVPLTLDSSVPQPFTTTSVKLVATSSSVATGTVTFWDGATSIGTATLVEGIGSMTTTLSAGVRRLKATIGSTQSPEVFLPVALPSGVCQ